MPALNELTTFDFAVAALFCIFLVRGIWVGLVRQLATLIALVGSYVIAGQYADRLLPWTERLIDNPKITFFCSFAILFVSSALGFILIGKVLHRFVRFASLGWLNRLVGMVLGGIKAAVIASLLYMFLASSLSATNEMLRASHASPYLKQGAELLRALVNDPRLRAFLAPKEPAILSDVLSGKAEEKKNGQKKTVQP